METKIEKEIEKKKMLKINQFSIDNNLENWRTGELKKLGNQRTRFNR